MLVQKLVEIGDSSIFKVLKEKSKNLFRKERESKKRKKKKKKKRKKKRKKKKNNLKILDIINMLKGIHMPPFHR